MSQQTIKQQARRTAREMAERRRLARVEKERRMTDLAEHVMVAIGERDQAVAAAEARAGEALREWTEAEGLTLAEMVEWCGGLLTAREAARLRRLADEDGAPQETGTRGYADGDAGGDAGDDVDGATAGRESGGVGAGTTAG